MPVHPPGHHKKEYNKQHRRKLLRAVLAYSTGMILLIIYQYLKTSPDIADFMVMVNRAKVDRSFGIQVLAILIMYVLPTAGLTTILATSWFLFFRKDN